MWNRRLEALRTYILFEVSSQLAVGLRKTINMSKKGGLDPLQRQSKRLNRRTVAAVLEEAPPIPSAER